MRILAQIAETVLWFAMWIIIPAALLYPCMVWLLKHTEYSLETAVNLYGLGIAILFLPTMFLTHFLYRKFILKNAISN
jgi:hypothetical protein